MRKFSLMIFPVLLALSMAGVWAQVETEPREPGDLQQAMQRYFHNRLRQELNLSDEEMQQILPRVQRMEQAKVTAARERAAVVRQLQRGLRGGAADGELQEALDRLERIDREHTDLQRNLLSEIDRSLTVRQRVQLRFFVERFRREMQRRIGELREERSERRRRDGPRQRREGR